MERDCLRRIVAHFLFILASASVLFAAPARAVDPADLLPVDEAFALTASAPSRDRIELDWKIADGYYLYRHRTSVAPVGGGFVADALRMPDGKRNVDLFFGEFET
jgi:thiol:disulfide interchange protein DsbD